MHNFYIFKKIVDSRKKPKVEFVPFNPKANKNDGFIDSDEKPKDESTKVIKIIQSIKTKKEIVLNDGFVDSD